MKTYKIIAYIQAEDVDEETIKSYAESALGHWGGQFHPEDPLFPTNMNSWVAVSTQLKKNRNEPV